MNFGKNPQHDFPKMRGGGSTAIWNFSENSSVLVRTGFPKANYYIFDAVLENTVTNTGYTQIPPL